MVQHSKSRFESTVHSVESPWALFAFSVMSLSSSTALLISIARLYLLVCTKPAIALNIKSFMRAKVSRSISHVIDGFRRPGILPSTWSMLLLKSLGLRKSSNSAYVWKLLLLLMCRSTRRPSKASGHCRPFEGSDTGTSSVVLVRRCLSFLTETLFRV